MDPSYDYIVVGGGLTGCALASLLKKGDPQLNILILEAGPDPIGNTLTTTALGGLALTGSDLDWAYSSLPQIHTNNRVHTENAGKALGGGSIINYGGWSRGDASDYDEWSRVVGDHQWSYSGLLPFFRKSENFFNTEADSEQHGFEGPIHVVSVSASDPKRIYGLRQPLFDAWTELGVKHNPNPSPFSAGISECLENWHNGLRQPSSLAYGLENVNVITNAMVQSVLFSHTEIGGIPKASSVLLSDGRKFSARKEIILSTGTFRTPQLLMLSGLGPIDTLTRFGIPVVANLPDVGKNQFDHFAHFQFWKVQNPEKGYALGNPLWNDPAYSKGLPCDWSVNEAVPSHLISAAVDEDNRNISKEMEAHNLSLLEPSRSHIETTIIYAPAGVPGIPVDGTFIASSVMLLLPTSRGSVSISSTSVADPPLINSNYYATKVDRVALIQGTKRVLKALLDTRACKDYIETEVPPPGFPALTPNSTDEEIDARIRGMGLAHKHAAGSAAMGKVVDTELRVKNVQGLRVVDASILPVAIGGHPQATLYALAEKAANLILQSV